MNDDARGLIELRGEDSLKFLQGQVTCDLNALEPDQLLAGCHCTPKGRVIFYSLLNFWLMIVLCLKLILRWLA